MTEELSHFIDGEYIKGQSGHFGDIFNPATGEITRQVPLASAGEVRRAIASAAQALPAWAATPPGKRAEVMFNFRDLLLRNIDKLAELLSSEHGKTLDDAKGSVTRAAARLSHAR